MSAVIEAVDVNHFYEGQLGWNHALDHLSLTIGTTNSSASSGPAVAARARS